MQSLPIDPLPAVTAEVSRRVRRLRFGLAIVGITCALPAGMLLAWGALELQFWMMDKAYAVVTGGAACLPILVIAKFGGRGSRWLMDWRMRAWRRELLGSTTLKQGELDDVLAIFR